MVPRAWLSTTTTYSLPISRTAASDVFAEIDSTEWWHGRPTPASLFVCDLLLPLDGFSCESFAFRQRCYLRRSQPLIERHVLRATTGWSSLSQSTSSCPAESD